MRLPRSRHTGEVWRGWEEAAVVPGRLGTVRTEASVVVWSAIARHGTHGFPPEDSDGADGAAHFVTRSIEQPSVGGIYLVPIAGGSVWSSTCQISLRTMLLAACVLWLMAFRSPCG